MPIRSNASVIMLFSNLFVFYQVMYVWTYCSERFINKFQAVKFLNKNIGS